MLLRTNPALARRADGCWRQGRYVRSRFRDVVTCPIGYEFARTRYLNFHFMPMRRRRADKQAVKMRGWFTPCRGERPQKLMVEVSSIWINKTVPYKRGP